MERVLGKSRTADVFKSYAHAHRDTLRDYVWARDLQRTLAASPMNTYFAGVPLTGRDVGGWEAG